MAFDMMDVFVKIGADTSGLKEGIDESKGLVESAGGSFAGGLGKAISGGLQIVGKAVAGATAVVGTLGLAATRSYAEYEQLVGGVDKLYGTASQKLQSYADAAYQTSGMSANHYMETATSFSAALINSLGGDVDKAADMTDVAMRAISDNVNVFGSDMDSVTNAFQGFAKQNYTMLDNLKLGYGGTKEEMARLIDDANEYRASIGETADLTMNSFADVVQAIQSIQEKQNIAGTTAKEAMTTIEGSANATKAAWENVITAIGRGEGLSKAFDGLASSIFGTGDGDGLLNQIIPRIKTVMQGIGDFIGKASPFISEKLPVLIESILPTMVESGIQLLGALGQGILDSLPTLIDAAIQIVNQIVAGIAQALPALAEGAIQIITGLANGLAEMLPTLIPTIVEVVLQIVQTIVENIPLLLEAGMQLLQGLVEGLISAIPVMVEMIPQIIDSLVKALVKGIPQLIQGTIKLIEGIVNALPTIIQSLISALPKVIDAVVKGLMTALPALIQGHIQMTIALVKAMPQIIKALIDALPTIMDSIVTALIDNMPIIIEGLVEMTAMIVAALPQIIMAIIQIIPSLVSSIAKAISSTASTILDAVRQILGQVGDTLGQKGSEFVSTTGEKMSELYNKVIEWLSKLPERMAYWAGYAIGQFIKFVAELPGKVKTHLDTTMTNLRQFATDFVNKAKELARDFFNSIVDGVKELPSKMSQLASDLLNAIKGLPDDFKSIGSNIVSGLWNGISGGWDWLKEQVGNLAQSLFQGAKDALGIESPSKKFMYVGQMMDEGLVTGINKSLPDVRKAMESLNGVIDAPNLSANYSIVGSADAFNGGYTSAGIYDTESLIVSDMVDAFVKALDRYGLTVEIDNRELGRVVRREVLA